MKNVEVYRTVKKGTVEGVKTMLKNYPLDPKFLNYGGYLYKYDLSDYSPNMSDEIKEEIREKEKNNMWKLSGNFHSISYLLGQGIPDLTNEQAMEFKKLIDENIASKEFQKSLREEFNVIKVQRTIHLNETIGSTSKWYITNIFDDVIPVDSTEEEKESFLNKIKESDDLSDFNFKKINKIEYRLLYDEKHFKTDEEYKEYVKYFESLNREICAPLYQFSRTTKEALNKMSFKDEMINFTFKSTGRKIKLFVSTYCTYLLNIDKIV